MRKLKHSFAKLRKRFMVFLTSRIKTEKCVRCKKQIYDIEWVNNWGYCDFCFDNQRP